MCGVELKLEDSGRLGDDAEAEIDVTMAGEALASTAVTPTGAVADLSNAGGLGGMFSDLPRRWFLTLLAADDRVTAVDGGRDTADPCGAGEAVGVFCKSDGSGTIGGLPPLKSAMRKVGSFDELWLWRWA